MPRIVTDLSSLPWEFAAIDRQEVGRQLVDDRTRAGHWLPATVPGDTRADLVAGGKLLAGATPSALRASEWVDECDWWYRVSLDQVEPGRTAVLEADGIDYLSSIWLDDRCLTRHEGMFGRQTVVLSPALNAAGRHELAVRIWGGGALLKSENGRLRRLVRAALARFGVGAEYFPDRLNVTKAQFSFGWDFAPRVLTCGIWDDIRLVLARGAYIEDVHAVAEPLDERADPVSVRWRVSLTVRHFDPSGQLWAEIALRGAQEDGLVAWSGRLPLSGEQTQTLTFDAPPMRRWWPWDQGEPYCYRITVRLLDERGLCDEKELTVGIRHVARKRLASGHPWRFTVNGRHVFLRGANWVPADILPGALSSNDYARLIDMAVAAGINYLRVWGGGLREKAGFYDECDRRGVLVSQEFPLACAFLDHYPRDAQYLGLLEAEATGIIRMLRNHPSLLAWCGGNEISPRRERLPLRTIERTLAREDPARPWMAASPADGDIHNWDVWHGLAPWQTLAEQTPPFMSEFGLQALPSVQTITGMFEALPPSLDDARWAERKLQAAKLRHYLGAPNEGDLRALVSASQRVQAAALQAGIEACRLRREGSGHPKPCGGVAFWQFNEPWAAVTWSVVERNGRPKAAYNMLKSSYAPLLVAARFARKVYRPGDLLRVEVWLVNDTPRAREIDRVLVELDLLSEDGSPLPSERYPRGAFQIGPASALRIDSLSMAFDARPSALRLTCEADGAVVAGNCYDLTVYLPPSQPPGARLVRRLSDLLLELG